MQGDALSRMDRESAARTFHTFMYAGYFNRFMKLRMVPQTGLSDLSPLLTGIFTPRQQQGNPEAGPNSPGLPAAAQRYHTKGSGDLAPGPQSAYGEVAPVWRFFEQVG